MTKFGRDSVSDISADVEELTNFINDQSSEQKILIIQFKSAMNRFASERSLDSCLEALNVCMAAYKHSATSPRILPAIFKAVGKRDNKNQ